jgi:protein involved in polysaccharide export with SLBB domain
MQRGVLGVAAMMVALAYVTSGCALLDMFQKKPDAAIWGKPSLEEPKIRPGLALHITVISAGKSDEQTKEVSANGDIAMPLVGTVKCDGLRVAELEDKLVGAYKQYMQDPHVTVQFVYGENMLSPWGTVLVLGQVTRPGPVNIPSTRDLTVTRALQLAGGATAIGDQTAVKITRTLPDGKKVSTKLDIDEIGKKGYKDRDIVLWADDVVYVPEIFW